MTNQQDQLQIADSARVESLLEAMANDMAHWINEDTVLIGILRRGAPLAKLLSTRLEAIGVTVPAVGELKLKRYDDDLTLLHEKPKLDEETLDVDVKNRELVLVDDVLFSGESMLQAMCFLRGQGARAMRIAVLCQRGHPTMPMRVEHYGLRLDVGRDWVVDCNVPPYEDSLGIHIKRRPEG